MLSTTTEASTISHYSLDEKLGEGGMGVVWRATDQRLGRRVAIKFFRPLSGNAAEMRRRFIAEARAASALDHPNICTVFEVDETPEGEIFIAMAYYEGETLDQLIARGAVTVERSLPIAIQAGRALAAAHEELIVHSDVKPSNIIVTHHDTVKLLDFGLACVGGEGRFEGIAGTPAYMSPEQLRGERIDHRTDIWSLGVVLYEMLSGDAPFAGSRAGDVIELVMHSEPPPLAGSDQLARLDPIVRRALAKTPSARYERMEEFVGALLDVQADFDTSHPTLRRAEAARKTSVAVLPFADMSEARDQEFLCDGMAEEILGALSTIRDLHVASRTSAFQFKGRANDIREIGAKLGVEHILEGSIRRAGDRVRISAQLISVSDGYRLWYERFDREMKDIFEVQAEIATKIAEALELTLVEHRGMATTATDTEAYSLYLQGRQFFHHLRRKALDIALQTFSRVIEIDPGYARAHAAIANCHAFQRLYFGGGQERVDAALAASRKALELAPELAEARAAHGLALFLTGATEEADQELARAIELDPRLYDAWYIAGRVSFSLGRMKEAAVGFQNACALVPEAFDSWYLLSMCYRRLGDARKARHADLECIEAAKKRVRQRPDDTRAWTMGAAVLAQLGEPDRAAEWVARALAVDRDEPIIAYNAACVYAALGRTDEGISCLESAVGRGGISIEWVRNDPDLDPLRDDPRFKAKFT
jgi:TolB-like protein/Flp pilus assembly protein TadD